MQKRSIATLLLFIVHVALCKKQVCVKKIRKNTAKYLVNSIFLFTFVAELIII